MEGDTAVILLQGGHACKGCGAGQIGLCKPGGNARMLRARNAGGGAVGDTVRVGLDKRVRRQGYLLSFVVPLLALLAGSLAGNVAGRYFAQSSLEVAGGFGSLLLFSFLSFRKLRNLDRSSSLVVKEVVADYSFSERVRSDEEMRYGL
ncbi:MAG: SoxR reducing system RseC family protein [Alphaproteobacteria bacterium]|uniref:SoxR reducing system RseC family protein n=1 Tax=Candidatus Nitrobium versatile TaxID=2884831 RepID=A0A953M1H0_9BACT|nr:SoxR reducing system RseC family protein [Candidatus Nitrobium versatile]